MLTARLLLDQSGSAYKLIGWRTETDHRWYEWHSEFVIPWRSSGLIPFSSTMTARVG